MDIGSVPVIAGVIILLASLLSLRFGFSVVLFEIVLGLILGNFFGFSAEPWMLYLAGFGGILLTFLAGTIIDVPFLKANFKQSMLLGTAAFIFPFAVTAAYCYFVAGWSVVASLVAGTALSANATVMVFSILNEAGLASSKLGRLLLAATFINGVWTALFLNLLFLQANFYTSIFIIGSVVLILGASSFSQLLFNNEKYKNKVIEIEIKYIFLILLVLMYLASLGGTQAILPAFLLGLFMSNYFDEHMDTKAIRTRLQTVAYAAITPFFFIIAGLNVSLGAVEVAAGLVVALFLIKEASKFVSVYMLAKKFMPENHIYATMLLTTGLTFGTISAVFGYQAGLIDHTQFSVVVVVILAGAIIPALVAEKWFKPKKTGA
jgi:Kef-type K+ transport system membrane component KefB